MVENAPLILHCDCVCGFVAFNMIFVNFFLSLTFSYLVKTFGKKRSACLVWHALCLSINEINSLQKVEN